MSVFSDNIKRFREERNLRQNETAAHIGTSLTQLRRWENAETVPSVDNAALLARFFNVSLDELYGMGKNQPNTIDISALSKNQIKAVKAVVSAFLDK